MELYFDNVANPIGIDGKEHVFRWEAVPQTAYRISIKGLYNGAKIYSTAHQSIYDGPMLLPLTVYEYQLEIFDEQDHCTEYAASFETGTSFEGAVWIKGVDSQPFADMLWFDQAQSIDFTATKPLSQAVFDGSGDFTVLLNGKIIAKTNTAWGQKDSDPFFNIPCTHLIQQKNTLVFVTESPYCGRLTLTFMDGSAEVICPTGKAIPNYRELKGRFTSPVFKKSFMVGKMPEYARMYICGLGYFYATLNGEPVSENWLMPDYTQYEKHVHYVTLPITVRQGENLLQVELGKGYYAMGNDWINAWIGGKEGQHSPKLIAQLVLFYEDGTREMINTDTTWQWTDGPTVYDNVFYGDKYNALLELNDQTIWQNAILAQPPKGKLTTILTPPIRTKEIIPCTLLRSINGRTVFDAGKVIAGNGEFVFNEARGTCIYIAYEEALAQDGAGERDVFCQFWETPQIDTYVCKGTKDERWHPKFSYKGFRYIILQGNQNPVSVSALYFHNDLEAEGTFTCSNTLFNRMYEVSVHTILNNMHSIPTDTPFYEKRGWTGDAQVICESAMLSLDMRSFFTKWLADVADTQSETGEISHTCPGTCCYRPTPAWMSAFVIIPYEMYRYYGDIAILNRYFDQMCLYAKFELDRLKDGVSSDSCYSDWANPDGCFAKEGGTLFATLYVFNMLNIMADICRILGKSPSYYEGKAAWMKDVINRKFFNGKMYHSEIEAGFRQSSNVLALALGVVEKENFDQVLALVVQDIIERDYHFCVGCFALKYLLPLLSEHGYHDVALRLANQDTYPSLGDWLKKGATAWLETWDYDTVRSYSHYFFGTIIEWFYKCIAGITMIQPAFQKVQIKPDFTDVPKGRVELFGFIVDWNEKELYISVPANASALLCMENIVPQAKGKNGVELAHGEYCADLKSGEVAKKTI